MKGIEEFCVCGHHWSVHRDKGYDADVAGSMPGQGRCMEEGCDCEGAWPDTIGEEQTINEGGEEMTTETKTEREAAKELRECPRCRKDGVLVTSEVMIDGELTNVFRVKCAAGCICSTDGMLDATPAIEAWNTRYEAARPAPADDVLCECGHGEDQHQRGYGTIRAHCIDCECIGYRIVPADVREAVATCKSLVATMETKADWPTYSPEYRAALRTLIAAVSGDGWISVEDRLPDEEGEYVFRKKDFTNRESRYDTHRFEGSTFRTRNLPVWSGYYTAVYSHWKRIDSPKETKNG